MRRTYSITTCLFFLVAMFGTISVLNAFNNLDEEKSVQVQSLPKGVSIHQLNNGMTVLLIENPALPMIGANVIVKVGSAYESFSTSGMSHMLEHLLFNGTTTRLQKQLYDDVDRIGGYNNASTTEFYTNYMMVTPTENIKKGMEIQADMLFNSTLPNDKFEKEKGIVLEEISKSIVNPTEQMERNTLSFLYEGHAVSLPTLGTYSTIQSMSRDNVNLFYKNNYVPNNMILSIIGNFKTKAMLSLVKEIYGKGIPGQVIHEVNPEWATGFRKPTPLNRKVKNYFYEGEDKVVQLFYPLPKDESDEYFQLMGLIFEKNREAVQSSLKSEFPEKIKSIRISTRLSHIENYAEVIIILSKDLDLTALMNSVSAKLTRLDFSLPLETIKSEAARVRTEFAKNIEKPHMFGIYYSNEIVKNGIESLLSSFSGDGFYSAAKELENFKLKSQALVLIQNPSTKKEAEKVETTTNVKQFADEKTGKNLIVVQNEIGNLLASHYLIKHKATYELKYGKDASKILHDCFDKRLQSDENQKISSQFGFTFTVNDNPMIPMDDIYLHPDFGYIRVEGLADDLPGAIKFLNTQMKDFIPTEDEFNKAVEKYKGIEMMKMGGDKGKKIFDEAYSSLIYESNLYSQNQTPLTYAGLMAFTKEYFKPSNMIISIVSPGSPETINSLFDQFTTLASKDEPAVFTRTFLSQNKPETIEKSSGGERSYIFWGFISQIDPKDAPILQALSLVLSDEIVFDIREKQGMAYQMSAGIEVIKNKALFFVNQGTRPQNVDKLVPQYPGFFGTKVVDALTQDGLQKSINMYLGRMMFRRLSSINQAYYLGNSLYFTNDFNYDNKFLDALRKIKLEDVKEVAKKYMNVINPILIIVR